MFQDNNILIGSFIFWGLIAILFAAGYAFAISIERTRWFVDKSFHFALWAAGWACFVILLKSAFGLTHGSLPFIAIGPIMLVVMALFILALLKIPAVWLNTITDVLARFKKRD